jgi:GH24 family phage-related lysozyme (muramidase)
MTVLTKELITTLRENIEKYEGKVNHMYLDSRGFVTVGVGHLLSTVVDAEKIPFQKKDGAAATMAEISGEYAKVKSQDGNRVASYYQQFTQLMLSDAAMDALTDKHIDSFYKELKVIYDGFDDFPAEVKLALFDLIFNLGMTALRKKWPKLNACIAARDWVAAAENCRRRGIADARNDYVKALLENSGKTAIA